MKVTNLIRVLLGTTLIPLSALIMLTAVAAYSQSGDVGPIRSSAAYAEVLLRKTEILADIEAFAAEYTEENPKMIELRAELASLNKLSEKLFGVKPSDTGKLTLALGKLIVKKASIEAELARLALRNSKDHPDVVRATKKLKIYDAAINEVLR